jgi:hypothetical protein
MDVTIPKIRIAARTMAKTSIGIGTGKLSETKGVVVETLHQSVAATPERRWTITRSAQDKKDGPDTRERRHEFSPHPTRRDRSGNCECTQVDDDYTNVCAFFDASPIANEADRVDDQLLSASIPHPLRHPRLPSLCLA